MSVYLGIMFITKIKNKVVNLIIAGISLGFCCTSKILMHQFFKTELGSKLCDYLADRPNANGCFVVAESLLRVFALAIIIFEITKLIKKQLTPLQIGVLMATLNILTLCRYTLDKHDFYKLFPFVEPIYFLDDSNKECFSMITFAIGLILMYLWIKDVFFDKRLKLPSLEKKDSIPMLIGIVIISITCYLIFKNMPEAMKIIKSQLYVDRMYLCGTAIMGVLTMGVNLLGHMKNKKGCSLKGQ